MMRPFGKVRERVSFLLWNILSGDPVRAAVVGDIAGRQGGSCSCSDKKWWGPDLRWGQEGKRGVGRERERELGERARWARPLEKSGHGERVWGGEREKRKYVPCFLFSRCCCRLLFFFSYASLSLSYIVFVFQPLYIRNFCDTQSRGFGLRLVGITMLTLRPLAL